MNSRRTFLGVLGANLLGLAFGKSLKARVEMNSMKQMIKPNALRKNDTVGVVAPGTAVPSPDDLFRAKEILERLELRPKFARNVASGSGYRTRSPQERVDELMAMFLDSDVRAIFSIRGGYGSAQLLDKIDYSIVRSNPKIFLGYSDITSLHIALNKFANLITFHGPVLLSAFSKYTFESLRTILFGINKKPIIQNPVETDTVRANHYIRGINPGKVSGVVIGGNLSIICSLLGTPYQYNFDDAILLLEDVQEEPYRIDRMLNQLRLAGILQRINGLVFGECKDCIASSA
ncbi:MAG: LD-carboxypeptidase, partial [Candidatus Kapaibacteriota bacterium]